MHLSSAPGFGSQLSEPGYRYILERVLETDFDAAGAIAFVMNNPSTADAVDDDATIRRCIRFAVDLGYERLLVVNTNPMRATNPREATRPPEHILGRNDQALNAVAGDASVVVAAWGAFADPLLVRRAIAVIRWRGARLYALAETKRGHPRHPLYLARGLEPFPWPHDRTPPAASLGAR